MNVLDLERYLTMVSQLQISHLDPKSLLARGGTGGCQHPSRQGKCEVLATMSRERT